MGIRILLISHGIGKDGKEKKKIKVLPTLRDLVEEKGLAREEPISMK